MINEGETYEQKSQNFSQKGIQKWISSKKLNDIRNKKLRD